MLKTFLKYLIHISPIPLTIGERIDRATSRIIKEHCTPDSVCVDVGAHAGVILDEMLAAAPRGHHYAFEPLPDFFKRLQAKYDGKPVTCKPYALSDEQGTTTFQYVRSNPTYSGIKRRKYAREHEEVEEIKVQVRTLDQCIDERHQVHLIKIDVEGAELHVLRGAQDILTHHRPLVIFEHGLGGADFYGYGPDKLWQFMDGLNYDLHDLITYSHRPTALSSRAFVELFDKNKRFYFVATPR